MTKNSVIHGVAFGLAVMAGSLALGAGALAQTVTVPPPPQTQSAVPNFPNVEVARAKPQSYADHMKALQQRKDEANAVLPVPRTAPTAPVAAAPKAPGEAAKP